MASLERRLEALEAKVPETGSYETPMYTQVYFKAVGRCQARMNGEEPPPYTQEEIEYLREDDLETVAGCGLSAQMRDDPGWQLESSQAILDYWEESAARRLEQAKDLPPERWCEVWGVDDEEDEE